MADPLKVDPVVVHGGGSHVSSAAQDAAVAFARHEADLAEAASGWIGQSGQVLGEFIAAVSERHAADHASAATLSEKMIEAATRYTGTDADDGQRVAAIADAMGL